MLKELTIKNYALIENLHVTFQDGLNIITGETGAGKSILIGALGLILGDRAQKEVIRKDSSKAIVEGIFELKEGVLPETFDDSALNLNEGTEIIIRREVHENGRSRCFVNDSPVVLSVLEQIGNFLVDLHGQHDHQALLKVDNHLVYLDKMGVDSALKSKFRQKYREYNSSSAELKTLRETAANIEQRRGFLQFQINEIESIEPDPDEEAELLQQEKILKNGEKIHASFQQLSSLLFEGEDNALQQLTQAENCLAELAHVDTVFENWKSLCHSSRIEIEEVMNSFQSYISGLDFDGERLEWIRSRLAQYTMLKKKYGPGTDDVVRRLQEFKTELNQIGTVGEQIEALENQTEKQILELQELAVALSEARRETAKKLSETLSVILDELGLPNSQFEVSQRWITHPEGAIVIDNQRVQIREHGAERIEFLISLNPGETAKPLHKVASGGEISRIMLAFKVALARADAVPVLIFDEIDTGVSGRIARVVGQNLLKLSANHQILCITHLPQIASMGKAHFSVIKESDLMNTRTQIRYLSEDERLHEVGKLLGGEMVTDSVLQNARELLSVTE